MARCGTSVGHMNQSLDQDSIDRLSQELYKCVKKDQFVKAKFNLKGLKKEDKEKIVSKTFDGNAALFLAAQQGQVHFVNYLLDECGADIEQRGVFEVAEDRSRHQVTPLWCASVANKLEVVKTLIRHNADVNATSDTQSTPVRSACYMTNIEVVKFLVDNGADIHKPNMNGGTCLINSVQSVELCKFLIEKNADVNAQDNSGNLALHYAIREGRMETVKLLLKHNSDPYIKNDFGDDAIQTASLRGYPEILSYLVYRIKPSTGREIEAYELMGTNFVDEKHDIHRAIQMWRQAMEIRQQENTPLDKSLVKPPISAYKFLQEATNMKELEEIVSNPDAIYMQSLMVRERLLGPDHKDTIFGLMYRGAVYADTHHYQRCVDLWKYAFQLRHEKQEPLNHECLFTLQALCKLFLEIHEEHHGGFTNEAVQYQDVVSVFDMACQEVDAAAPAMNIRPVLQHQQEDFQTMLQLLLHLVHLLGKLASAEEQMFELRQKVHTLLRKDIHTSSNKSLLHLALERRTSHISDEYYSNFPSLEVVDLLLECGAQVNCKDEDDSTPLHYCAEVMQRHLLDAKDRAMVEKITNLLLAKGAHADARNKKGLIAGESLSSIWYQFRMIDHVTLKCIAARAIMTNKIPYLGEVPPSLHSFIEIH